MPIQSRQKTIESGQNKGNKVRAWYTLQETLRQSRLRKSLSISAAQNTFSSVGSGQIREAVENNELRIGFVPTGEMVSDIFTKAFGPAKAHQICQGPWLDRQTFGREFALRGNLGVDHRSLSVCHFVLVSSSFLLGQWNLPTRQPNPDLVIFSPVSCLLSISASHSFTRISPRFDL